jgi:hypothetical protein
MPNLSETKHGPRQPLRSFWILTLVAIAATGSLSATLAVRPGTLTGVRFALSGLVLVASITLGARIMLLHERARRRSRG